MRFKKVAGIVLSVLGGVILLGELSLALTKYDLRSTHDLNRLFFGLGIAVLIIVVGFKLINKPRTKG